MTGSNSTMNHMRLFGLHVVDATGTEVRRHILRRAEDGPFTHVAFLNANNANIAATDADYRSSLSDALILPDGVGVDIGAKLLCGRAFRENLNGTDFVPEILRNAAEGTRLALIGAKPGIAEQAAQKIAHFAPQLSIVTVAHGYLDHKTMQETLDELSVLKPGIILVAMGTPMQEKWVNDHLSETHGSVVITVGALFDFLAGEVTRAPEWVRKARFEWLYRLAQEPGRLWKRYVLGNIIYLARVLAMKLGVHSRDFAS